MKIKIQKKENQVVYSYDEIDYEFNYDNINTFISKRLSDSKDGLEFETEADLSDYQELLIKINTEISKADFIAAAKEVEDKKKKVEMAETTLK